MCWPPARPDHDVLALEVWRPGIAAGLAEVATAGATNVRFCSIDAAWSLAPPRARLTRSPSSGRSSPTPGRRSGTTSVGWSAASSRPSRRPACDPVPPGGSRPTGPTTPTRCVRCSTRSRRSTVARCRGGPSVRSRSSSGRGSRGRPLDHRPLLPGVRRLYGLRLGEGARRTPPARASRRARSWSSSGPGSRTSSRCVDLQRGRRLRRGPGRRPAAGPRTARTACPPGGSARRAGGRRRRSVPTAVLAGSAGSECGRRRRQEAPAAPRQGPAHDRGEDDAPARRP